MVERRLTAWLRPALTLFSIAGLLALAGCGGGSGAPNNPYAPPPPAVTTPTLLPTSIALYPGTPATLTISGGVAPYRAFSSNPTVLPVAQNVAGTTVVLSSANVTQTTAVDITVQDAIGQVSPAATVNIIPAPLLPSGITITRNGDCAGAGENLCSGGTGTARVKVTAPSGAGIPGRAVRFDVVQGAYSIVSTNPATPLVSTLTVTSDVNGDAVVGLQVAVTAVTQTAVIRATDLTTGNQVTGNFTIQQVTSGVASLTVLPQGNTTINGPLLDVCSTGVRVTHYIFGGTPPYRVTTNFPDAVTITGTPVATNGGGFDTITNGTCFIGLTYTITDATGATIPAGAYPTVTNAPGTTPPPPPPPTALTATPNAFAKTACVPANTFQFILTGGTQPYSAVATSTTSTTPPVITPQTGIVSGSLVTVSGLTGPPAPGAVAGATVIAIFDSATPSQSTSVTITCN